MGIKEREASYDEYQNAEARAAAALETLKKLSKDSSDYDRLLEEHHFYQGLVDQKRRLAQSEQAVTDASAARKEEELQRAIKEAKAVYESLGMKYKLKCLVDGNPPDFKKLRDLDDVKALMYRFEEYLDEQKKEKTQNGKAKSEEREDTYSNPTPQRVPSYSSTYDNRRKERKIEEAKERWEAYSALQKLKYIMTHGKPDFQNMSETKSIDDIENLFPNRSNKVEIYQGTKSHYDAFNEAQLRWQFASPLKKFQYIMTNRKLGVMHLGKPQWGQISLLETEELNNLFTKEGGKKRG